MPQIRHLNEFPGFPDAHCLVIEELLAKYRLKRDQNHSLYV